MTSTQRTFRRDFSNNREIVIQRDGEKCVECGMTRLEHKAKWGRDITVDHVDGNGRNQSADTKNNSIDNLQTLCLSCHGKKDIQRHKRKKKLTQEDVGKIKHLLQMGHTTRAVAGVFGVSQATISLLNNGKLKQYD